MNNKKLSLIIPCYNEEDALPVFFKETIRVLKDNNLNNYEILFIDDGSKDNTLNILKKFASADNNVVYLSFSRNFGKEAAMYAGFCNVTGDYIAVLDADMQDPPALLPDMIKVLETDGYDSVATRRINRRNEPPIRSWFAKKFYHLINRISDADIVDGARDFRLMKKDMVDAIIEMAEVNRFSKGIFGWIGFRTYWFPYENVARVAGKTKWSFWKLFKYAIEGIINFSQMPLNVASWFGMGMTFFSFFALLFVVLRKIILGDPVAGWASTICVIVFIGGIQLFCTGIMGQYVAKTYLETKQRPHYIISQSNKEVKKIG